MEGEGMTLKFVLNEDYKMTAEIINDEYVMCVKNGGKNDAPM